MGYGCAAALRARKVVGISSTMSHHGRRVCAARNVGTPRSGVRVPPAPWRAAAAAACACTTLGCVNPRSGAKLTPIMHRSSRPIIGHTPLVQRVKRSPIESGQRGCWSEGYGSVVRKRACNNHGMSSSTMNVVGRSQSKSPVMS